MNIILEGILQGLFEWIYGLFLDLIAYCADALLSVMSTDLEFWETSVPVVATLYQVFVSVGWGLLIGNCAFQAMKAMFAGLGFETESPAILLFRTAIFGTLLIFSYDICDIGLSLGKNVINLLGIPDKVEITFPDESFFESMGASWILVIIIGFILGFQLIRLFFEIAERYVIVAILTLLCPVGLAMGGSKSTKDICVGYIRTYASMVVMMVMNVLFLKLILSALATMPDGIMVLPWCLLVVGIARTARKADNLISKIGLNPATTGDPLGHGRGMMVAMMAARTIVNGASRVARSGGSGHSSSHPNYPGSAGNTWNSHTGPSNHTNATTTENMYHGGNGVDMNSQTQNNQSSHFGNAGGTLTTQSTSARFGSTNYTASTSGHNNFFNSSAPAHVNANRFGSQEASGTAKAPPTSSLPTSLKTSAPSISPQGKPASGTPGSKPAVMGTTPNPVKGGRFGTNLTQSPPNSIGVKQSLTSYQAGHTPIPKASSTSMKSGPASSNPVSNRHAPKQPSDERGDVDGT